jgi:hypothetical protein
MVNEEHNVTDEWLVDLKRAFTPGHPHGHLPCEQRNIFGR